jgi:FkbM family methyltransferase
MLEKFRVRVVLTLKGLLYGRRGEPYRIGAHTLRFVPGTRPVRLRYRNSPNDVTRYDALQLQYLADNVKAGDTAIDIGAHHGQDALLMSVFCGASGRVAAFEPDPYAREILMRNLELNPGVPAIQVVSAACSDREGEAVLYSSGGNSNSSLTRAGLGGRGDAAVQELKVPLVTLDGWIGRQPGSRPRWVKIDVEGAEIRVLKGARELLASDAHILCELHPYAWSAFGDTLEELKSVVAAAGRRIRYLDQEHELGEEATYGIALLERVA